MKQMKGKMIFTLVVVALVLCFSMGVAAETPSDTVNATIFADAQLSNAFTVNYQMVHVNSYLAESYGYTDEVDYTKSVSAMDVMVKLHELKYGSAFTATTCGDYLATTGGWIGKAFGDSTHYWGVAINGESAHSDVLGNSGYDCYLINQTPISDGDVVEVLAYQEAACDEQYIWPMNDGDRVDSMSVDVGEKIDLTLKGYLFSWYSGYGTDTIKSTYLSALSGVQFAILNKDGSYTDIDGAVSDGDGNVTVSFDTAGNYYLVAYMPTATEMNAFMAVIRVYVYGDGNFDAITDVKEGDWYYDAVGLMVENQIMKGVSKTSFAPNAYLTRAMFATTLYRLAGTPYCTMENPFNDVPDGAWYSDALVWAYAMGITTGKTATTYDPNGVLTREQMAAMIYRFYDLTGMELPDGSDVERYSDDSSISDYAQDAVYSLTRAGFLKGIGNNTFAPQKYTTRAQAAQVYYNITRNMKNVH